GGDRVGSLCRMIEAFGSHGCNVREATLDLVGDCQCGQQIFATAPCILACSKHGPDIVAGMAGLIFGKIAVVEVQVAHQGRIIERGAIGSSLHPTDEGCEWFTPKVLKLSLEPLDWWSFDGSNGAAQCI